MRHFFPIRQVFSHTCTPSGLSPCQSFSSAVDVRQVTLWCKEASLHPSADLGGETASQTHQTSYVSKTGLETLPATPKLSIFAGNRTWVLSCCAERWLLCNNMTIFQHLQSSRSRDFILRGRRDVLNTAQFTTLVNKHYVSTHPCYLNP